MLKQYKTPVKNIPTHQPRTAKMPTQLPAKDSCASTQSYKSGLCLFPSDTAVPLKPKPANPIQTSPVLSSAAAARALPGETRATVGSTGFHPLTAETIRNLTPAQYLRPDGTITSARATTKPHTNREHVVRSGHSSSDPLIPSAYLEKTITNHLFFQSYRALFFQNLLTPSPPLPNLRELEPTLPLSTIPPQPPQPFSGFRIPTKNPTQLPANRTKRAKLIL